MVDNLAFSICTTGSWTGVNTFLLDTGLGQSTLRAQQTLWPTVWRSTKVTLETGADWSGTLRSTLTVWSTGVWIAGVSWLRDNRSN